MVPPLLPLPVVVFVSLICFAVIIEKKEYNVRKKNKEYLALGRRLQMENDSLKFLIEKNST